MTARKAENLWILFAGPTVWAAHFLLSYVFAAIHCAKAASVDTALGPTRLAVAVFTVAALAVIAVTGAYGWRRLRMSSGEPPPDDNRPARERRRFMGLAILLLSGLSAVATIYVAVVVVFFENCR
ncbi:MAG: hypothetical protein ACREVN_10495 [Gammaproteobacteria bacterium]